MPNWLTGPQAADFKKALLEAFDDPVDFAMLLGGRLDKKLAAIAPPGNFEQTLFHVINRANNHQWATELLGAALAENPRHPDLRAFARSMGIASEAKTDPKVLEKIVGASRLGDIRRFSERLGAIELAVCMLKGPSHVGGTGTLVGPDIVLTNHHVIAALLANRDDARATRCVFDFKRSIDGRIVDPGRPIALAEHWHLPSSPHSEFDCDPERGEPEPDRLDCALIRLAEPIGEQPIGKAATMPGQGQQRGWIDLTQAGAVPGAGAPILIVQHPQPKPGEPQEPMQLSIGSVLPDPFNGLACPPSRLRYTATTLPGSSGSLCFDDTLTPVGLHHLGDPRSEILTKGEYNQAVALIQIIAWLNNEGITFKPSPTPA